MEVSRRSFLKLTAGTAASTAFCGLGISLAKAEEKAKIAKFVDTKESTTICCYCAVGCGAIVHTSADESKAVNIEGDPDHPINEGSLCPKGSALKQLNTSRERPPKPLYRAPYATEWQEMEWDEALERIAKRMKETRDSTFEKLNAKGELVNRTESIVSLGSAAMDNEECWTYQAFLRSLGLVNIEHQARI